MIAFTAVASFPRSSEARHRGQMLRSRLPPRPPHQVLTVINIEFGHAYRPNSSGAERNRQRRTSREPPSPELLWKRVTAYQFSTWQSARMGSIISSLSILRSRILMERRLPFCFGRPKVSSASSAVITFNQCDSGWSVHRRQAHRQGYKSGRVSRSLMHVLCLVVNIQRC